VVSCFQSTCPAVVTYISHNIKISSVCVCLPVQHKLHNMFFRVLVIRILTATASGLGLFPASGDNNVTYQNVITENVRDSEVWREF
jgi:hypothetical protein